VRWLLVWLRKIKVKTKTGTKGYWQIVQKTKTLRGEEKLEVLAHLGSVEKMLLNHKRLKEGVMLE